MNLVADFESLLTRGDKKLVNTLNTPFAIQKFLDEIPYVAEELDRSPLRVLKDRQAHCLDGGIFAALALNRIGQRALIIDLVPEPGLDDDHVLALYRHNSKWGCIAKSNYAFLRFREPVYQTLRELAMTFFESYTSVTKEKTLRGYTRPLDLERFTHDWLWDENGITNISKKLYKKKPIKLIDSDDASILSLADDRFYQANTLGTNFDWAYGIRKNP